MTAGELFLMWLGAMWQPLRDRIAEAVREIALRREMARRSLRIFVMRRQLDHVRYSLGFEANEIDAHLEAQRHFQKQEAVLLSELRRLEG